MAKKPASLLRTISQGYPRIEDPNDEFYGYLDDSTLVPHQDPRRITLDILKKLIARAIYDANLKSSREILAIPVDETPETLSAFYQKKARELFIYFHAYPSDPAATAHEYCGKTYRDVGIELLRNRALQKGRMNSGWRYQFLAVDCARESGRFAEVAGFGASQGDFMAKIYFRNRDNRPLHLYVSVKNRSDTLGGQDWPNSIAALEAYAKSDVNKTGPYLCVFGIAMNRGLRRIPRKKSTNQVHSENTEIWLSDFFWPFFSGYGYEEIMTAMLQVLVSQIEASDTLPTQIEAPDELLNHFGELCKAADLIDDTGYFNDPFKLVRFFCGPRSKSRQSRP